MKTQRPIREGLFEMPADGGRLIGSRCRECSEVTFPASPFCPQCCRETTENISLSQRGALYSFTIQRFKPPPPFRGIEPFAPYGVGMIELPEGLRVTAVLEESDPEQLQVGMEMELVITKFFEDDEGNDVLSFKFRTTNAHAQSVKQSRESELITP